MAARSSQKPSDKPGRPRAPTLIAVALAALAGIFAWRLLGDRTPAKETAAAATVAPDRAPRPATAALAPAAAEEAALEADPNRARVRPRGEISGRVLDAGTRKPVKGAWVSLNAQALDGFTADWWQGEDGDPMLATNQAGEFRFSGVPAASYAVKASAGGYVPAELQPVKPGQTGLVLLVAPGGVELRGKVEDVFGVALPGATVGARLVGGISKMAFTHAPAVARSDERGQYRLSLSAGTYELSASGRAYAPQKAMARLDASAVEHNFVLIPSGRVAGLVRDAGTGQPIANADVYVRAAGEPTMQGLGISARSDAEGKFVANQVAAGALQVYAASGARTSWKPETVRLAPGESAEGLVLWLQAAGEIRGRVVEGSAEAGIPGAMVTALALDGGRMYTADSPSDAEGNFHISGVLPGALMVQTVAEGWPPGLETESTSVRAGQVSKLTVKLTRGVTIRGKVMPPRVADIRVEMKVTGQEWAALRTAQANSAASTRSADDGSFVLTGLAPAQARLVAQAQPAAEGLTGELALTVPPEGANDVVIPLRTRAPLRGRVRDTDGGIPRGRVDARRSDNHLAMMKAETMFGMAGTALDDSGSFEIPGLAPGKYVITLSDDEGAALAVRQDVAGAAQAPFAGNVVVTMGETTPPVLNLVAQARRRDVLGVVVTADGRPASGVLVTARPAGTSLGNRVNLTPRTDLTEGDGAFVLAGLVEGRTYSVTAEHLETAQRGELAGVRIDAGTSLRVQLQGHGSLTVTVTGLTEGADCTAYVTGARRTSTPCGADGKAVFTDLTPGKYQITVDSSAGHGDGEAQVSTTAGSVAVALRPWGRVQGRLVATSGAPVADIPLVLRGSGVSPQFGIFGVMAGSAPKTDASGNFDIPRVPAGSTELLALLPGRTASTKVSAVRFQVGPGQTTKLGDVRLGGGPPPATAGN